MNRGNFNIEVALDNKKGYVRFIAINMLIGILIYLTMISQHLTNHYEGLWTDPYFNAGIREVYFGQWFCPFIDRLRMGYGGDPFNSYLSLLYFVLGNLFLLDTFAFIGKKKAYLFSAMILASTTISACLSYRYMSPTFGLSYFFSIVAVWILYKVEKTLKSIFFSGTLLCLSLGLYQANLGCSCLLIIGVMFVLCFETDTNKWLRFLIKSILSILFACILYRIIWDLELKFFHITVNPYSDADRMSVSLIIQKFPDRFAKSYSEFYKYFFTNSIKHSIFQHPIFYGSVFFLILLLLLQKVCELFKKAYYWQLILECLGIILIPPACNISVILVTESDFLIQQTAAMAILLPVLLCMLCKLWECFPKNCSMLEHLAIGMAALLLYGNVYMTAIDLEVMHEGRTSSEALMHHIVDTIIDNKLYGENRVYLFLGRPSDNPLFVKTQLWDKANNYARYGEIWVGSDLSRKAYDGLLRNIGVDLLIGPDIVYDVYTVLDEIKNMPLYPSHGSILEIDDYVFIKISDTY